MGTQMLLPSTTKQTAGLVVPLGPIPEEGPSSADRLLCNAAALGGPQTLSWASGPTCDSDLLFSLVC